jgi:hypothetical protein
VTIEGDHNTVVIAHPQAMELLRDESAIANAKKVVQPLLKEGYERLEFEFRFAPEWQAPQCQPDPVREPDHRSPDGEWGIRDPIALPITIHGYHAAGSRSTL